MSALISPEIKKQYFDSNGDPLSGGKLYIYEAGTTTPLTTYTDEAGLTPNANPIILDARGEIGGLFLGVDAYKFVLKDSDDTTIWTVDNITSRDIGAELDAINTSITSINTSISTDSDSNRLVSGKMSSNSSQSRFLVPINSANQVKVLATATSLIYVINGTQYSLVADLVGSGLSSPATTNNTALINDSTLSGQAYTKSLGEFGSIINYDTAGSEITSRDGELHAFKVAGAATEYFTARIDNANSCLLNAKRGYFYDLSGNPIERTGISDNNTITLMKLSWLYLVNDGSLLVSYTEPVYSATQPASPSDGDMWFDMINNIWKRFNSTVFIDSESMAIGTCIQDENGNTVGARSDNFYGDFNNNNTFECEFVDTTSVRSKTRSNSINVYGTKLNFFEASKIWNIVNDIESGETEAANTEYYNYIKENGDSLVSPHAPYDRTGDLKGFYHPYETWRYVSKISNDSSSDYVISSLANSLDAPNLFNALSIKSKTASYSIGFENEINLMDATSGALTVNLPPASLKPGGKIKISKIDASANFVTIATHASENINTASSMIIPSQFGEVELISNGANWIILNRSGGLPTSYTPTFTSYGTCTSVEFVYTVMEKHILIQGRFVTGTVVGSEAKITLPAGMTVDSSLSSIGIVGSWARNSASTDSWYPLALGGDAYFGFAAQTSALRVTKGNGNYTGSGEIQILTALVPIEELA